MPIAVKHLKSFYSIPIRSTKSPAQFVKVKIYPRKSPHLLLNFQGEAVSLSAALPVLVAAPAVFEGLKKRSTVSR